MHKYANPAQFNRLADRLLPWIKGLLILTLSYGLYSSIFIAPEDYQQSATSRIMFIHVPSAWMSMLVYMVMATASFTALVWKHPLAYLGAKSAAPIGALFTAAALLTGALWGKPTWGTYWMWDGRMTSVLVLFFLYLGYMAIWSTMDDEEKAGKASSILALVGVINIPIIKFSVDWWNGLHQGASIMKAKGPSMPSEMWVTLFIMFFAFQFYFALMFLWRMKTEINAKKIAAYRQARIAEESR
ncbi:heme ABC transporter permease [Temperatibacter marinus]|uniref:Heme exporter protein C n=1 Tax=Temperatibacter marinus TaxID=1456591 RepID=A0AA52H9Z5_9PROT|nr:heme ABC transporter permease [Temperatibacter marinus]WND03067.1 heme ABC transporter permease [Temperatibacter marinus]